jgi:FkbM family methyltransferase
MVFNGKPRDLYLRSYSGDLDIFYEIFWKKAYMFNYAPRPGVIIDLGANIGLATLFFLNAFPDGKVIAVEPEPGNLELLKKNLEEEINIQKVIVSEAAVSGEDDTLALSIPILKYNATIKGKKYDAENSEQVKVMSMQTLLETSNLSAVDILKIDIEGSEKELFSAHFDWLEKIREISIEFHSSEDFEFCEKVLRHNNFELQSTNTNDSSVIYHWRNNVFSKSFE